MSASSPPRPRRLRRPKKDPNAIPGMIVPPRPKPKPIEEMEVLELRALYDNNERILSTPSGSNSSVAPRIFEEQEAIHARLRLLEQRAVEGIQNGFKNISIAPDNSMVIDKPLLSPTTSTKQRALAIWGSSSGKTAMMPFDEAMEIEQRVYAEEHERRARIQEKKEKHGWPERERPLTREEYEARVWSFMTYKPTDSDLEDEEDEEDEDPSTWFVDDQDDGRKGQNIVYPDMPDAEDLSNIIRIDDSRIHPPIFATRDEGA